MVAVQLKTNHFFHTLSSDLFSQKKSGQKYFTILAKKKDLPENSKTQQFNFQLKLSNTILTQSAIAVFGLGFIDAGYSGDWSRIGVVSKENEDLLKIAAFLVVPLCIFLIFSISREEENKA